MITCPNCRAVHTIVLLSQFQPDPRPLPLQHRAARLCRSPQDCGEARRTRGIGETKRWRRRRRMAFTILWADGRVVS